MPKHSVNQRIRRELKALVESVGAEFKGATRTKKQHIRLFFQHKGRRLQTIIASTPSDHRAYQNVRAQMRNTMRTE